MPWLSRLIKACAYNTETSVMAFRYKNFRMVVEKKRIVINDIENETDARMVMDWLAGLLNGKIAR